MLSKDKEDKLKNRLTFKTALILGIAIFSFLYGIDMLLLDVEIISQIFEILIWLFLFGFFTYLAICSKKIDFNLKAVLRFLLAAIVGVAIICCQPWSGITKIGAYANGPMGVLAGLFIVYFVTTSIVSIVIYGVMSFGVGKTTELNPLVIVRFVLIASLSAVAGSIFTIVFLLLYQIAPSSTSVVFPFFDGLFSQLIFGITYYYTGSLFIDDMRAPVRKVQE